MKRLVKFTLMVSVLVLGAYAGHFYANADQAAVNCPEIQQCLQQGYTMDSCVANPIYYFVPPTGDYEWGTVSVQLSKPNAPIVWTTCHIKARNKNGKMQCWESHTAVYTPVR